MKILISIFLAFILIILTSKLKINVQYLEKGQNSLKIQFNVNLGIYLFGFLKIVGISLKEDGIYILFFRIPYHKLKIEKESIKILKEISGLDIVKSLNLKLNKLYFDLKVGSENMMFTVFSVFVISTFFSILPAKNRKQINIKKYYYNITPIYNTNSLSFKISSVISIPISNLIKTLNLINKNKRIKKVYNIHIKRTPIKI